jgi:uncharacterized membrane protein
MNVAQKSDSLGKRWKILLLFSLAANFLIVGIVAGSLLRPDFGGREGGNMRSPLRDMGYGPFGHALSQKDRKEIGRALGHRAGDLRNNRDEMRAHMSSLLTMLRAQPFDAAALRGSVAAQQSTLQERQIIGQNILLNRVESMSDSDRSEFADRLEESLRGPLRQRK